MILSFPNPSIVPLQVTAQNLDGTPKFDIVSGMVRVYYLQAGPVEVDALAPTALSVAGSVCRYLWSPASLGDRQYVVEFSLVDADGLTCVTSEDLIVKDIATQSSLTLVQADMILVRQVETGHWKIEFNQMVFYADDGITPLLRFNLYDPSGAPAMDNVSERIPA